MLDLLYTNGDLTANKDGDLQLCINECYDIIQTANNNIMMRYGHNKWYPKLGNKIFTMRIKANQNGIEEIARQCTNAILTGDTRVKEVSHMSVTIGERGICIVDYRLVANIDGELKEIIGDVAVDAFNINEEDTTIKEDPVLSNFTFD